MTQLLLDYRRCSVCGEDKPLAAYSVDKKATGGRSFRCKICVAKAHKIWRAANLGRIRAYNQNPSNRVHRSVSEGFIPESQADDALRRLIATGYDGNGNRGKCECCGKTPTGRPGLAADHDHATSGFRGWVCYACNNVIGTIESQKADLAREYLDRAKEA